MKSKLFLAAALVAFGLITWLVRSPASATENVTICFEGETLEVPAWQADGSGDLDYLNRGATLGPCPTPTPSPPKAKLTVRKDTDPETEGVAFRFLLGNGKLDSTFVLEDDESIVIENLSAGRYVLSEIETAGWKLNDIACTGTSVSDEDADDGDVVLRLADGDEADCFFNNVAVPTPTPPPTATPAPPVVQTVVVEVERLAAPRTGDGGLIK